MNKKRCAGLLLVLFLVLTLSFGVSAELEVYFLDVDQAESILLHTEDVILLIDAGDMGRDDVVPLLKELGVPRIDVFIVTHPHADHIGQAVQVLETFPVAEVWMSGSEHNTNLYEDLVDAILRSDAQYWEPRRGDRVQYGKLIVDILNPVEVGTGKVDLHDEGLVIRALYGEVSFLFTGDMERKTENKLLAAGVPVRAQILNLGHHGSRTSSSLQFLEAVAPAVAIYSAGRSNPYGHPHQEIIDRLRILGVNVYGTDRHGTIVVTSDGVGYEVVPSRREAPVIKERTVNCIDINTASRKELQRIIHIGPARADEIIRLRKIRLFTSLDDLSRVTGLGEKRIEDIKDQGIACVKE